MASTSHPLGPFPPEIWLLIIPLLNYPAALKLSQGNRFFRGVIDLVPFLMAEELAPHNTPAAAPERAKVDHSSLASEHFACLYCMRLRSRLCFSDSQVTGKRGKLGPDRRRRFCVDCGMRIGQRDGVSGHLVGQWVSLLHGHQHKLVHLCSAWPWAFALRPRLVGASAYCRTCELCCYCLRDRDGYFPRLCGTCSRFRERKMRFYAAVGPNALKLEWEGEESLCP